jgi:hypothetical protein
VEGGDRIRQKEVIHYVKAAIRLLPPPMVNKMDAFARKTGLNLKD